MERLHSVRRAVVRRNDVRQAVYVVSLLLVAATALLALDGVWAGAIPVLLVALGCAWLSGAWVRPHSGDAYVRRLYRIWGEWAAGTRVSYGRFERKQSRFPERVRALSPPPERLADHERLVSLVEEHERLRSGRIASASHAFELTTAQRAARQAKDELQAACNATAAPYASDLDKLFGARKSQSADAAAEAERETEIALRKLEQLRPPLPVAAQHASLVEAFRAHLDVTRRFHGASAAADPERTAKAVQAWMESVATLREAAQAIRDALGYSERWPALEPPTAVSERGDCSGYR